MSYDNPGSEMGKGSARKISTIAISIITFTSLATEYAIAESDEPLVLNLSVQGHTSPPCILHISSPAPILGWMFFDTEGGLQTQFEVNIGSSPSISDMWSTGPVSGGENSIVYAGLPLLRGRDYWFAVRVSNGIAWSEWVDIKFHMNSIPSPPGEPAFPANDTILPAMSNMDVEWPHGTDADGDLPLYEWQVARDRNFTMMVASGACSCTRSSIFSTIPGMTYYWRVRARDTWEPDNWSGFTNEPLGYWIFHTATRTESCEQPNAIIDIVRYIVVPALIISLFIILGRYLKIIEKKEGVQPSQKKLE